MTLRVAAPETTVLVATNVQVETTTNTLGGTITTKAASDLPVNGRLLAGFLRGPTAVQYVQSRTSLQSGWTSAGPVFFFDRACDRGWRSESLLTFSTQMCSRWIQTCGRRTYKTTTSTSSASCSEMVCLKSATRLGKGWRRVGARVFYRSPSRRTSALQPVSRRWRAEKYSI